MLPAHEVRDIAVAGAKVLVVDDQKNMRATTAMILRDGGHFVREAEDGPTALQMVAAETFDIVLTDLRMGEMDGLEVLRGIMESSPTTQVIVMTAYGTIESAVEAIRCGAYDYVAKPFKEGELLLRVAKAVERRRLLHDVTLLAGQLRDRWSQDNIVGRSDALRELLGRVARVAATDATVLVTGESGTGKELVARAIHRGSRRADKPFVPVNCAAITATLLESELFGHAKGAFTGASRARRGLFEEANGGTLFIDEIGETELGSQAKLLRALQEGEIRRVGESLPVKVDVRLIAATNQDLKLAVAEKRFREDLYYRLAVVPLRIPPLRERAEDIPLLAQHFVERFVKRSGEQRSLSPEAMQKLLEYPWPGNVRELENMIEHAAALATSPVLGAADIRFDSAPRGGGVDSRPVTLAEAVEQAERRAIENALSRNGGELSQVARELGVSSTTLWRKMKRLGM